MDQQLVYRRTATAEEDAALSSAAALTVERLAARGLVTRIVSERLNRPQDRSDPRGRVGRSAQGQDRRAVSCGWRIGWPQPGSPGSRRWSRSPVPPPRRRVWPIRGSPATPSTSRSGSRTSRTPAGGSCDWLWERGIAPEQVLIAGDELGPLGGLPGSDSLLLAGDGRRATAVSVGVEPERRS